jgi:hypothetical protein
MSCRSKRVVCGITSASGCGPRWAVTTIGARDMPPDAAGCGCAVELEIETDELGGGTIDAGALAADIEETADAAVEADASLLAATSLDDEREEADDGDAGEVGSFGSDWAIAASGKPAKAASAARSTGVGIVWSSYGIGTQPAPRGPRYHLRHERAGATLSTHCAHEAKPRRSRFGRCPGWRSNRILPSHASCRAWHWIDLAPPSWRCVSLTVADAAQVGSVLADLAPCFPFNRLTV